MKDDKLPNESARTDDMPESQVARWLQPFAKFLRIQSASGLLLLACTTLALLIANSPWSAPFFDILQIRLRISVGTFELDKTLLSWLNDGLMTIFFFVVGLEIKRELVNGELRDPRKAALPIIGALGGMIVPAGIFLLLQGGQPGQSGWGIPVATDIAFVAGFLAVLGSRIPPGLKVMLLSLAIVDDLGAILLIAFFYSTEISIVALGFAAMGLGLTYIFNRIGIRQVGIYVLIGTAIWLAFSMSGVHPTVAGVLLGFLTPSKAWVGTVGFPNVLTKVLERLVKNSAESTRKQRQQALSRLVTTAREGTSPLERLEFGLHPWVAFLIMPLFALANAGVRVAGADLGSPVAIAVAAGLILGKPLGIVLFSWIATKLGLARLPTEVNWKVMLGSGCLGGIGLTMSIFIGGLAMQGELLNDAKVGTLVGSTISAILGCSLLLIFTSKKSGSTIGVQENRNGRTETQAVEPFEASEQTQAENRWHDDGGQGGFDMELHA